MYTPVFARSAGFALLFALFVPTACSDSVAPPPGEDDDVPPPPAAVGQFLQALPPWDQFSPPLPSSNVQVPESTVVTTNEVVDGVAYTCESTPYSIIETPEKIVTLDPDANILWLGALLQGDGYRQGIGSLREWTVRERAPLEISIDLLASANRRRVANPNLSTMNQAVGELVAAAEAGNHRGGSSVSFQQENTYSVNQAMLKLGLSAGYASVSVKASLSASRSASERTVTAYFVQRMFTASVVLPDRPDNFFTSAFTEARLAEEQALGRVGPSNIPVYIASITYGRILMFSFTSTANITDIRAALSASFSSLAGGSISGRYLDILNQAQIKVVTLGGEGRNATALIQSGQLKDYFEEEPALTSARPISYVVRNVGDNSIARVSETSAYDLRECTAIPSTATMRIDVSPNDASVYVSGPNNFTAGPSTGDQDLTQLPPGGYTLTITRTGYDSTVIDTSVAAGEHLDVPVSLVPENTDPTGAYYTVVPTRLVLLTVGCTGEQLADPYYTLTINGVTVVNQPRTSSVARYAGEQVAISGISRSDTIRTGVTIAITVNDDDGAVNPPDPMGNKSVTWNYPNVPVGVDLYYTITNVSGCSLRLFFNITKGVDVFTAPPPAPSPAPVPPAPITAVERPDPVAPGRRS